MLVIVMGVSGSGKSTIASKLSDVFGVTYIEADDYHSLSNKKKMSSGVALTEEDREPWLESLHTALLEKLQKGHVILACSALRREYRQLLLEGIKDYQLVYLKGDFELIHSRLKERKAHFMPPELLANQFDTLEEPLNACTVDIRVDLNDQLNLIIEKIKGRFE